MAAEHGRHGRRARARVASHGCVRVCVRACMPPSSPRTPWVVGRRGSGSNTNESAACRGMRAAHEGAAADEGPADASERAGDAHHGSGAAADGAPASPRPRDPMTRKFRVARRAARERRRSEEWPNPDSEGEGDDGRYSPSMSPEDESGAARVPRTRKMSLRRGAARSASRSPPSEDELRRLEELAEYICSSEEEEMWHPCHVPARLPEDEEARLATLFGLKLLDTELDGNLSCMVTLAARTFGTSMAWIALVERDREWYMAKQGIMYSQTHRDIAFGAHSILQVCV